jgi:hypothetical protein
LWIAVGNDEIGDETYAVVPDKVETDRDTYSDIENPLPCIEDEPACELTPQTKAKKGFEVASVPVCEYSDMPQFKDDEYRYASISRIPPQQRPWISHRLWKETPQAHVSKHQGADQWRQRWTTRHDARARVEDKQVWNMAAARRSALIMALEVDVAAEELFSRWPTIVIGHQMFTFGICNLPPLSNPCHHNTYVQISPMCGPYLPAPETAVVNAVNVAMAAQFDHADTPDVQIQVRENPGDAPVGAQNSATAQDFARTMVWAGYTHTCVLPTHLRSAPESCLVYRRIVEDLSDNNKILEDTFAILCTEPHKLEIALYYCDHPQHFARGLTETATPGVGVQMNRSAKAQHDFGIRRWLADTGCGHDLVQSSLALSRIGEAFIRLRAPKYLNAANGPTSIRQEMTMCIPQSDEMAEMLCCENTPSVISIGERCLEMGCAFYWPPYSENPSFVKPDDTHVVVTVENNIPYLTGGNGNTACPGAEGDGNDADEGIVQASTHPIVQNDAIDENATPRGDDP